MSRNHASASPVKSEARIVDLARQTNAQRARAVKAWNALNDLEEEQDRADTEASHAMERTESLRRQLLRALADFKAASHGRRTPVPRAVLAAEVVALPDRFELDNHSRSGESAGQATERLMDIGRLDAEAAEADAALAAADPFPNLSLNDLDRLVASTKRSVASHEAQAKTDAQTLDGLLKSLAVRGGRLPAR